MESVKFISIIWLLPLIFMLHDFEEIIFMEWWVNKERLVLLKKYPQIAKEYGELSTAGFALAVSEIFVIIIFITLTAIIFKWYYLWFGGIITFFVHLIMHLIQWIIYKKYIPAIATVIPAIIYSVYAIYFIYNNSNMEILPMVMWSILSMVIFFINLIFVHKLAGKFTKFLRSSEK